MKTCTTCKVTKKESEFHKKGGGRHHNNCKICRKAECADYYTRRGKTLRVKRLPLTRKWARKHRMKRREWFYQLLQGKKCKDCGFSDVRALDFDHVRGEKKKQVSELLMGGWSKGTILAEIAKCDIRCKNCHAIRTAEQQNHYKHRRLNGSVRQITILAA